MNQISNFYPPRAEPYTRCVPLAQHFAAEAEQFGGPPAAAAGKLARALYQALFFHQAAEILLVQLDSGNRLHRALQIKKREGRRHQLKYNRTVFHLAAQPRDGGGEDAAMVEHHRMAERWFGPCSVVLQT